MTQQEKRGLIATKVMGWHEADVGVPSLGGCWMWEPEEGLPKRCYYVSHRMPHMDGYDSFRPDTNRDQLAEVEAKLTEQQQRAYMKALLDSEGGLWGWKALVKMRHADPAVCVDAIVEMLEGEKT